MHGSGLIQLWMVGSGAVHVQSRNCSVVIDWFTCGSHVVHSWFRSAAVHGFDRVKVPDTDSVVLGVVNVV